MEILTGKILMKIVLMMMEIWEETIIQKIQFPIAVSETCLFHLYHPGFTSSNTVEKETILEFSQKKIMVVTIPSNG